MLKIITFCFIISSQAACTQKIKELSLWHSHFLFEVHTCRWENGSWWLYQYLHQEWHLPYSTCYKHMGDLPYISAEQGGWAYNTYWAYIRINIQASYIYLYKNFELRRGWAYNTPWAYSTYYTVLCAETSRWHLISIWAPGNQGFM